MKKILSLLLCLCLLAGTAVLLASCGGGKSVDVDLAGYKLIYDDAFTSAFKSEVSALTTALGKKTGATFKYSSNSSAKTAVATEILVGETSREESATLKEQISGDGYAVGLVNGKLVLVGTSPLLTLQAINLFEATYLTGEAGTGTTFSIKTEVVSNVPMVELDPSYAIVYAAHNDDVADADPGSVTEDNPNGYDYPVVAAKQVRSNLKELMKLKTTSLNVGSDKITTNPKEILVGIVNREASVNFAKQLDADEYGVKLDGNNLVVLGLNDTMLRVAVNLFDEIAVAVATGDEGDKTIRLPADFCWIQSKKTSWVLDFPRPDGVDITGSVDVGEGSLEFYYAGETATPAAYEQYCTKLLNEGYTLITENELEDSIFRGFVNKKKNISLYVTYAAYKHAEEEGIDLFVPCIRIISAKANDTGVLPDEKLLTPDYSYTKLTDSTLTGMRFNYSAGAWGNSYIIQLEDGSFFVQDGGSTAGTDYVRLYNVLSDLFYRSHGYAPSISNPIIIAGWYLSHGHGDHYGNFREMCKRNPNTLRVEYLFANMPSDDECYNVLDPNLTIRDDMLNILNMVKGGTTYIKLHSGQVFHLRNLEIQVMYTHEDIYPQNLEIFNDSSTVLRTVIHNTDGNGHVQGKETSVLWTGDLCYRGSKCVIAMYGDTLKADIVQLAHHGYRGCEYALYENAAPSIVLWPNQVSAYTAQTKSATSSTKNYVIDYKVAKELSSVQYIVILDTYNTTITITKDGPDMSIGGATGLYNAYENGDTPITKYGGAIIKK